jgi:hypothetical protein
MTALCSAFRNDDLRPCKKHAMHGRSVCSSHRTFYRKDKWTALFCRLDSPFLPTGLGYPQETLLGRIETAITFALTHSLVVLTEEDCATIACPPPGRFNRARHSTVDLWTLLVQSGKVNAFWNINLTRFAIFTFAKMRTPLFFDIAPSLESRLGGFLKDETIKPYILLDYVLIYLDYLMRRQEYSEPLKVQAYKSVLHEFLEHPSFKGSLFLSDTMLTESISDMPYEFVTKENQDFLIRSITEAVAHQRAKIKMIHHNHVETFKEELVMKVFHPTKVSRWLDEGGFELLEMMF